MNGFLIIKELSKSGDGVGDGMGEAAEDGLEVTVKGRPS